MKRYGRKPEKDRRRDAVLKRRLIGRVDRLVSWLKISYSWLFKGGRKYVVRRINQAASASDVLALKNNVWLTKGKYHKNHWATKQFIRMCDDAIELHKKVDALHS